MKSHSSRFGLSFVSLAAALAVLVIAAGPTFADTDLGHIGSVGPRRLVDTSSTPGTTCYYSAGTHKLTGVKVRAPKVKARDTSGARDRQRVG